ncbi:37699_t:CDS:2, partial [Gigaspora margarita]
MLGILVISNKTALWNASPMVQSCKHLYKNLINNVLLLEQFYHLHFVPTIYIQIFPLVPSKKYHLQQVIWIEDSGEELWAPSLNYTLNDNEFVALSNFYQANLNEQITELPNWGVKYSKLQTKEDYIHGSSMTIVAANTQNNACIMYELEINIAKSKDPKRYELQQFFGQVQYYFCYMFCGKYQLLAYIKNVKNAQKGPYGIYSFEEFGNYEFVNVSMIRRCVGFLKVEKYYHVISRELNFSLISLHPYWLRTYAESGPSFLPSEAACNHATT